MRPTCQRLLVPMALLVLLAALTPRISAGQGRVLAVVGGAWEYDLSGTGTSGFGGLRLELPVRRVLVIEPGLTYAHYSSQFELGVNYLLPEIQAQIQVPGRWVRPFLGGGLGLAYAWAEGASATDLTLSGSAGVRVRVAELWSTRAELRVRSIDPSHDNGTVAEWTLGIARRF
jgi:hypothetical protein